MEEDIADRFVVSTPQEQLTQKLAGEPQNGHDFRSFMGCSVRGGLRGETQEGNQVPDFEIV